MRFKDRREAGKLLAKQLTAYTKNAIVLAIPRGGIPIGYEIAKHMHCPLSIVGVRKIGSPYNPEFAIGAIAENQIIILDNNIIEQEAISHSVLHEIISKEKKEMKRRITVFREAQLLPSLRNKNVIIADDGLATGFTAKAAILAVAKLHPKSITFSSPVCSADSLQQMLTVVDNIVCLITPADFEAIGEWYDDFSSVSDRQAISLLEKSESNMYKKQSL